MTIATSGIISGIDTAALIQATLDAASGPRSAIEERIEDYESRVSKIAELASLMGDMEDALEAIQDIGDFRSFSATYDEDDAPFTVETDGDAIAGTYDVTVNALAVAQMDTSNTFAADDDDTIFGAGDSLDVTYDGTTTTIDLEGLDLSDVADAINDIDGVSASVVNNGSTYQLLIAADDEGEAITYTETYASGPSTQLGITNTQAASDAEVEINGITITSDTNTINAIPGLTFTLNDTDASAYTVIVAEDPEAIEEQVQTFVDAYNAVISFINVNSVFDDENDIRGPFVGEGSVQRVANGLRMTLTSEFTDLNQDYDALSLIGIELDSDGELSIDSDTFQDLLVDEPDQIADLFTGDDGFIQAMLDRSDIYTDSIDGSLEVRQDSLEDRIEDLEDQIDRQDRRLARLQARLQTQYAGMESLLGQLNSSSSFLSQVLAGG